MAHDAHRSRLLSVAWLLVLALLSSGCDRALTGKSAKDTPQSADDVTAASRQRTYYAGGDWANENMGPRPPTSLIQILAVPDYFHQKKVIVEGYLVVKFEETGIFFSSEDARYWRTGNGLWVDFSHIAGLPSSLQELARKYNGKQVSIEGTFNRDNWGHMNGWPGTIERVSRITFLKDRSPRQNGGR